MSGPLRVERDDDRHDPEFPHSLLYEDRGVIDHLWWLSDEQADAIEAQLSKETNP